jgi:hypothetical protein
VLVSTTSRRQGLPDFAAILNAGARDLRYSQAWRDVESFWLKSAKTFIFPDTETSQGFRLPIFKDAGCAL